MFTILYNNKKRCPAAWTGGRCETSLTVLTEAPVTYTYAPVTPTPVTYTYAPLTQAPVTYTYAPITQAPVTYTYAPVTQAPVTYTYAPVTQGPAATQPACILPTTAPAPSGCANVQCLNEGTCRDITVSPYAICM